APCPTGAPLRNGRRHARAGERRRLVNADMIERARRVSPARVRVHGGRWVASARDSGYGKRVGMQDGLPAPEGESANALHPAAPRGVCARARADVHRTLLEVSRATASHRDLESLLRDLTGVLQRVAPFDVLRLVLHDPERDVMRLHTLAAIRPVLTTVLEVPTAGSPSGVAMLTQQPVVVPSIDRETRFSSVTELLRAEGMKSFCAIPLTSPLRRLGALHFASHEEDAFDMWAIEFAGKGLIKEHMLVPVEGSPAGVAFTAGEPKRFERADLAALESEVGHALLAKGIQSMCSVPLTVHDRRLGTLSIGR